MLMVDPQIPNTIDETNVQPSLEVSQLGWGYATFRYVRFAVTGPLGAQTSTLVARNDDLFQWLWWLSVDHQLAAAGGILVRGSLNNDLAAVDAISIFSRLTIAAEFLTAWGGNNAVGEGPWNQAPVLVPPKSRFDVSVGATAAGDTIIFNGFVASVPVGFALPK